MQTALHKAALNGHLHIIKYLLGLDSGVDVHAKDADGYTALHNACSKGAFVRSPVKYGL